MQITDILAQMGGLKSMAQELGVDEAQAASSAAALAPAILGGFKKQAQSQPTGLEGFGGLLGKLGLDSSLLKKMLPMLAMLVTGYLAKQQGTGAEAQPSPSAALGGGLGGGLGDLLGGLLGGQNFGHAPQGAASSGLASMLDMNGDGNALDDILRIAGKAMR